MKHLYSAKREFNKSLSLHVEVTISLCCLNYGTCFTSLPNAENHMVIITVPVSSTAIDNFSNQIENQIAVLKSNISNLYISNQISKEVQIAIQIPIEIVFAHRFYIYN